MDEREERSSFVDNAKKKGSGLLTRRKKVDFNEIRIKRKI